MDGLVCPKLASFLRLTQKLKAKIQKKTDSCKGICPICGCKSHKGNLCQACFFRSFRPIAYTRNIKVVEQKEFFYGPGKDRRWRCKRRAGASRASHCKKAETDEDVPKMIMSSTKVLGHPLDSLDNAECSSEPNLESTLKDVAQTSIATPSDVCQEVKPIPSGELVKIDLDDTKITAQTEEDSLEPLPKFVPDFWEAPPEEGTPTMTSKVKTFTDHVIKEAQRPFKEIFCDSNTDIITQGAVSDEKHKGISAKRDEMYYESLSKVQQKLSKTAECCKSVNTETQCTPNVSADRDQLKTRKQLKQNAILELLKVAFKTNVILNNLFQYFKKVVESDGSNSDNSDCDTKPQMDSTEKAADCDKKSLAQLSMDSFFFPNQQSPIQWGNELGDYDEEPESGISGLPEVPNNEQTSETEVIHKSQATLSMLMNPTRWRLRQEDDLEDDQNQDDFIGPCPGYRNLFEFAPDSPGDRFGTRKYHSEHSKLTMIYHRDDESRDTASWSSSDLEFQPFSVIAANDADGCQRNATLESTSSCQEPSSATGSEHSGKSLLDFVFGLNRSYVKPSLVPLPDCQQDLITLTTPEPSKHSMLVPKAQKDADSQTALSSRHLEQEMDLLHQAFLDQLAHFSVRLVESCKTFGHSWQTGFLVKLVDHFQKACGHVSQIIGESSCQAVPSVPSLVELQKEMNQISICLAKLRNHPHSFISDCSNHDIVTLLSPPQDHTGMGLATWV